MIPIYRKRDGYQSHDRNDEVFEYCQQKLFSRVALNIFVEGEHHLDKRVLAPHKGIARIAFGAYERNQQEDLQVVPVGCNYVNGDTTRDEAKIIVGSPRFIKDYWPGYQQNPNAAINQLCKDIFNDLKSICYHIEDPSDDALAEQQLALWRNDNPAQHLPIVDYQAPRFWGEKALLDQLNAMPPLEKKILRDHSSDYFAALEKAGLKDEALTHPEHAGLKWLLFLIPAAPIALFGLLIEWPLRWLVYRIVNKVVKKIEFYTSILMGVGLILGGLYCLGLLIAGLVLNAPYLVTISLMLPLLAWFSIFWKETLIRWKSAQATRIHPERENLLAMRKLARN